MLLTMSHLIEVTKVADQSEKATPDGVKHPYILLHHSDVLKSSESYLSVMELTWTKKYKDGWTLHYTLLLLRNGHLDVTKYLISKGAEVNKGNNDGYDCIIRCCFQWSSKRQSNI